MAIGGSTRPQIDLNEAMLQRSSVNARFNGPDGQEDMTYLLSPGPVTTTRNVKFAALADFDPCSAEFISITKDVQSRLLKLCGADESYACIFVQGAGTQAVESVLSGLAPARGGKTLVVSNGEHGERAANILQRLNLPYVRIDLKAGTPVAAEDIRPLLQSDRSMTHIWLAHCDSGTGTVNPIGDIAAIANDLGRQVILDATATMGALPISAATDAISAIVGTSSVCIQALPGLSFCVVKKDLLNSSMGRSQSFSQDLFEEWRNLESSGQFRFSAPTHLVAALQRALKELVEEGGHDARRMRYERNARVVLSGMRKLGFTPLLADENAGPIVQVILAPADGSYNYDHFHAALASRGFSIAPGRIANLATFRVGTAGNLDATTMNAFIDALKDSVGALGIQDCSAAPA
jgi:2-aminoethylphosphonate-pyruvate transaminase